MNWLPYEKWEIRTPVNVLALAEGLGRYAEPFRLYFYDRVRWSMWWKPWPPFYGKVDVNGFHLRRRTLYMHPGKPMLSGRFVESPTGTTIRMTMTLQPFVAVFMVIWFGLLGVFGAIGFAAAIQDGQWMFAAAWGGMLVFGVGMTCGGYWLEAPKAKRLLAEILAQIEREAAARATSTSR